MVAGSLIAWIPKTALPVLFRTMGIVMGNQGFVDFATWSVTPLGIVIIGTICTIITFVLMILPTRTILRILEVGFFLGLLAWVILYFQLGTAAKDAFPAAWDKFMGAGSYAARIDLAKANGMVINPNVGIMTLAGLIMGFWIFYGYYIPTFFAGEVKQAEITLIAGSLGLPARHLGDLRRGCPAAAAPGAAGVDCRRDLSEQCRASRMPTRCRGSRSTPPS